jgi:hypothetical protein
LQYLNGQEPGCPPDVFRALTTRLHALGKPVITNSLQTRRWSRPFTTPDRPPAQASIVGCQSFSVGDGNGSIKIKPPAMMI